MDKAAWKTQREVSKREWFENNAGKFKGNRWFTLRLDVGVDPVKFHPIRPEHGYKDKEGRVFPWLRATRHYVQSLNGGKGGYLACAGGIEKPGDQCLVEIYQNPQEYGYDFPASASLAKAQTSSYNVISGMVEEWFHLVKVPNKKKDGFYTNYEKCTGRHCKPCTDGAPKVFGKRAYYSVSGATWRFVFEPLMEELGRYCKCGGYIVPINYVCRKCSGVLIHMADECPKCGNKDVQIEADPKAKNAHTASCSKCHLVWELLECRDKELAKEATNPNYECPHCKNVDFPSLVEACSAEGCEGHPHDIYDCQFTVRKKSEDRTAHTLMDSWNIQEVDPRSFDPEFQGGGEYGEKIAARNREHIPLDEVADFVSEPPHVQARMLEVKNPFTNQAGQADVEKYGKWSNTEELPTG